jgi:hypothetical protein
MSALGPRAWKSLWRASRGDQPEITVVYAATAQYISAARPLRNLGRLTQQPTSHMWQPVIQPNPHECRHSSQNYTTHAVLLLALPMPRQMVATTMLQMTTWTTTLWVLFSACARGYSPADQPRAHTPTILALITLA